MFEESVSLWASMYSWFTPTVLFVVLNLMIGTIAITSSFATNKQRDQQQEEHQQQYPDPFQLARSPSMLQRLKSISLCSYRSPEPASSVHIHKEVTAQTHVHYAFQEHQTNQQEQYTFQGQTTPHREEDEQHQLARSPSFLQRLKSSHLYHYLSPESVPKNEHSSAVLHKNLAARVSDLSQDGKEKANKGENDLKAGAVEERDGPMEEIRSQPSQVERTKSDTIPASGEMPQKLSRKMRKSASTHSAFSHFEEKDMMESQRPETVRERKVSELTNVDEEVDAKADDFINRFKQQLKLQRLDSIVRYKEMIGRGSAK